MTGRRTVKTAFRISTFVCAGMVLGSLTAGPANAQDPGAIVGRGAQVVVPPSVLTDLVAVAPGVHHSLGLKGLGPTICRGDLNCDGAVDGFDIRPFVLALTDPDAYELAYPHCNIVNADVNGDSVANEFDIQPFVNLLVGKQHSRQREMIAHNSRGD